MRRKGTTLIEALVAIALVATVLPVALQAVTAGSQAIERSRRAELAHRVAQARLARMLADGSWSTSASSGTYDASDGEDADGMQWNLAVATWRDSSVRTIALTVTWGTGDRAITATATTLAVQGSSQ